MEEMLNFRTLNLCSMLQENPMAGSFLSLMAMAGDFVQTTPFQTAQPQTERPLTCPSRACQLCMAMPSFYADKISRHTLQIALSGRLSRRESGNDRHPYGRRRRLTAGSVAQSAIGRDPSTARGPVKTLI